MSYSTETRLKSQSDALLQLLQMLGENPVYMFEFCFRDPPLSDTPKTTIRDLEEFGYITEGDMFTRCYLAGGEWLKALELSSAIGSPELNEKAGKLSAHLKGLVKGRREDAYEDYRTVAAETGLSEGFVWNAIESRLLETLFKQKGAWWERSDWKTEIQIPLNFGLDLI